MKITRPTRARLFYLSMIFFRQRFEPCRFFRRHHTRTHPPAPVGADCSRKVHASFAVQPQYILHRQYGKSCLTEICQFNHLGKQYFIIIDRNTEEIGQHRFILRRNIFLQPAKSRVVIMRTRLYYAILRTDKIHLPLCIRIQFKLQYLHAWKITIRFQAFYFRRDYAQIFRYNRYFAQIFLNRVE